MSKKIWVITKSYNDYSQHGDYLVAVFTEKPSMGQLKKLLPYESDECIDILLGNGGGRIDCEDVWYYLTELVSGELYIHS